ncbi:MAG: hypothetical protein J6T91_04605 [Alphaproteobacteria bacterium]|nr:hypothetical protein [Alphaproteobacteria bacterium]
MRNIFAIFLVFLGFDCCGRDFDIGQFVGSALNSAIEQGAFGGNTKKKQNNSLKRNDRAIDLRSSLQVTDYLRSQSGQTVNRITKQAVNQIRKQSIKFLKRGEVFPEEEIKKIEISPNGQRVVCLIKEGGKQYLKNILIVNSGATEEIREKYPINDFVLFGKNIVYTYYNKKNILNVKAKYSTTTARLLNLPSNLRSVRFFKNNSLCMAECYDGEEYTLYSIRNDKKTKKFLCKKEKHLSRPTQSLFNNNLNPVLTIKNENGLTNVYANQNLAVNKPIKRRGSAIDLSSDDFVESEEDELPNSEDLKDSEDSNNLMPVGQIHDPDSEKYFSVDNKNNWYTATLKKTGNTSVDNNNNWYTATLEKTGNTLVIDRKKISQGDESNVETHKMYSLRNVSSLSRVRINLDQNGVPSFISVSAKKYNHFTWDSNIKMHLNVIGNKFNYASWYRVNTSSDGKIWLICVMSDKLGDQFFTYNTVNRNFTLVPTNPNNRAYTVKDYNDNKFDLRSMSSHYLSKGYVHVFFVRGVKSTTNSPLIVMTNSLEQYDWRYMPTVQILANRGFNVLCLNYRKSEEDFAKALREIINSNIEQRSESHEDESDDDEENDGEKNNREELSSDELEKSERIVNESVNKAVADIKEAINWAVKSRLAKYGNIILFAENHSIIPAMRLFLKNQASFAGFIAIDPSEDDISLVSAFDYGENLKPTIILGSFERSESIKAFLSKVPDVDESNFSVVIFKNLIDEKLATGVVETFLHKIFSDKKIESISQEDINSLPFIKGEIGVEESSNVSNDSVISNWK